MGFLSRGIKQPVSGTGRVMSVFPREGLGEGKKTCHLTLNVQAPGVPAFTTEVKDDVPVAKWPAMGTVLPVTVDRAKPERLEIEWDRAAGAGATQAVAAPTPAPTPAPAPPPVLTPANSPAAPAPSGDADVLARLTRLRDAGVLSPVEFEQQKQRMLGA